MEHIWLEFETPQKSATHSTTDTISPYLASFSQVCHHAAATTVSNRFLAAGASHEDSDTKGATVLYLDTKGDFSVSRMHQLVRLQLRKMGVKYHVSRLPKRLLHKKNIRRRCLKKTFPLTQLSSSRVTAVCVYKQRVVSPLDVKLVFDGTSYLYPFLTLINLRWSVCPH